jgi:hypothetical protein
MVVGREREDSRGAEARMKIEKYGVVILTQNAIKVEGWQVERERSDPPESEATHEQLLLETVIPWAQKKMNTAIMENLRRISKEIKEKNPTTT